ncbi:MAG: hypothetical protein EBR82_77055 [Caulobacteraceae bacterium]|nr:hypothetical protein [Caulobacteraceae bacterium]
MTLFTLETDMVAATILAVSLWASEPLGHEYAVPHGGRVLFWIEDERPPAFGTVVYLWGYYPVIRPDGGGIVEFAAVSWCVGEQ